MLIVEFCQPFSLHDVLLLLRIECQGETIIDLSTFFFSSHFLAMSQFWPFIDLGLVKFK